MYSLRVAFWGGPPISERGTPWASAAAAESARRIGAVALMVIEGETSPSGRPSARVAMAPRAGKGAPTPPLGRGRPPRRWDGPAESRENAKEAAEPDSLADTGRHALDRAGPRRPKLVLHLHSPPRQEPLAGHDRVPRLDGHGHDSPRD